MKKIVLYGNTNFARLIKYYIENDTDRQIAYFTVDKEYLNNREIENIKVISYEDLRNIYNVTDKYEIINCIGYKKMGSIRENIYEKCKMDGFTMASYIHSSVCIPKGTVVGEGNIILENVTIQPFCKIGKGNLIWYNSVLAHNACVGNFNTLAGMSSLSGYVTIGNNCFIGNNSTIREYVKLSDYTLVGAATYIYRDTVKFSVHVPAKGAVLGVKSIDIHL